MRRLLLAFIVVGIGALVFLATRSHDQRARASRAPAPSGGGEKGASEERTRFVEAEASSVPKADSEGLVTGRLSYPHLDLVGEGKGERPTAVVLEEGLAVATTALPEGPFEIAYSRASSGGQAYSLEITLSGCRSVELNLPALRVDVGRVILFPTITYGGWVRHSTGSGMKGVTVQLWSTGREVSLLGSSEPTEGDGRYVISFNERVQLLPTPQGDAWQGVEVHALAGGRSVARVGASVEGLRGTHVVTAETEVPQLRLRCVDARMRQPLPGTPYVLRPAKVFDAPRPTLDAGRTNEAGEFDPIWPASVAVAVVRVGGVRFLLNRQAVLSEAPTDLLVPEAPGRHAIGVRYAGSREPVAGAHVDTMATVDVQAGAGPAAVLTLSGVTDEQGDVSWAFQAHPNYDAQSFRFIFWRVVYPDEHGNWRVEVASEPVAATKAEDDQVRAVVEVGKQGVRRNRSLWMCLREGGAALQARPQAIGIALIAGSETRNYFWGVPAGPGVRDAKGRFLWRFPSLAAPVDAGLDSSFRSVFTVIVPGHRAQRLTVTIDDWAKASESTHPLVLDLAVDSRDLTGARIRVIGVDGNPAPNVVVVLSPVGGAPRKRYWVEARRVTTDAGGYACLWSAADGVPHRVVARDPISGAAGVIREFRINADKAPRVVRLEAPKAFETTVVFEDGTHPKVLAARLESDPPNLLPTIRCAYDGNGKVLYPRVPIAAYHLYVEARRPGDRRFVRNDLPAARAYRTSVVLSKVRPKMAPPPPPPLQPPR